MTQKKTDNSVIIIGAGFAGLATGIYARMNGYDAKIFEMHTKPGGLCTSWKRKDYTFDGCIHWLVGSSPLYKMHEFWEEVGIVQDRIIINMDEYLRFEGKDGRTITFHTDVDKLEKHLLSVSPQDEKPILEFTGGIRMCIAFKQPSSRVPLIKRAGMNMNTYLSFILKGSKLQQWMKTTAKDFSVRFKDPLLSEAFREMWFPDFSMLFMLFTFAYLHNKNAGYPIGGSLPMSMALEKRYKSLGGDISYGKKVEKILTEKDRAVGVRLEDGTEYRAARVVSAADGHSTIFRMLDGSYANEKVREPYETWPVFPSLIYVGLGVNRSFKEYSMSVSGMSIPLSEPQVIGDEMRTRLWVHPYNHDPSMAPDGKTSIVVMMNSDYEYWRKLSADRNKYDKAKDEVAKLVIAELDKRFPGLASQVEAIDVATPLTFERYTGNWNGSFEGWLITPSNSYVMMKPMSQTLPGLQNFYMCGQWVEPGGGLPTGVMSGRRLLKRICKEDHRKFMTTIS